MYRYPTRSDLTPAIIIDAYSILSRREFTKKNAAIMAKHFYIIIGVLQNEFLGEPDTFTMKGDDASLLEDENFNKLEKEIETIVALEKRFGGESNISAPEADMDPATILMLAKLAMELIKMIRERRKPKNE